MPVFGICRGFQEMSVAFGCSLHPEIRELPGRMNHRMPRLENGEIHPDPTVVFADRHDVRLAAGRRLRQVARLRDDPRQLAARPGHPRARQARRDRGRGGRRHDRGDPHRRRARLCARRAVARRIRPAAQSGQSQAVRGVRRGAQSRTSAPHEACLRPRAISRSVAVSISRSSRAANSSRGSPGGIGSSTSSTIVPG